MIFRNMTVSDIESVICNERQTYSHPWTEKVFKGCIAGPSECWVVCEQNAIIGHLVISSVVDEGHILNLCIGRDWQGKGLAHKVLVFAIQRLRDCHANTVFLEVRASNLKALSLYASHGFTKIGLRKNYYPLGSAREDAVIMSKTL